MYVIGTETRIATYFFHSFFYSFFFRGVAAPKRCVPEILPAAETIGVYPGIFSTRPLQYIPERHLGAQTGR